MRVPARATALAVALALMAGCSGGSTEFTGKARNDKLSVVSPLEVHSLDPATSDGLFTRLEVAETLVATDTAGALTPGLATAWKASADRLTWEFTLRRRAVFHDGTPVDAAAVVASLARSRDVAGTPLAVAPITAISTADGSVRITLSSPYAALPAVVADTSAQVLAASSYAADGHVHKVVGSGPYRVVEVQQPTRVTLAAHEKWDGAAPAIRSVSYQAVGRAESRSLMAQSGQSDVTFGIDPTALQGLAKVKGLTTYSVTLPRTIVLKANAAHPALSDVRVRRAISIALDRESMAAAVMRDRKLAADQLLPPSLPQWHRADVPRLTRDVGRARALLVEAGWSAGSDGVLRRDGKRFALRLRTFPDRAELPPLATAIQAALAEIGIKVEVAVGNSSEIPAAHRDGSLELALFARNFALVPDPLVTLIGDLAPGGADWGVLGWHDDRVTAALADLADGAEPAAAVRARTTVTEVLQNQLPLIPVVWYRQSAVVSDALTGMQLDQYERSWRLSRLTWAR
jgi:peptide/nickel transport system substrate-binding protein